MGTGPQKYPGASTAHWHQDNYPGTAMESNVGVLHTTEGTSLPSYGGGASAPNFTAMPDIPGRRLRWYQHFDFDVSSRALVNASGGVETNTLNCVQVELVGTCDPARQSVWGSKVAGADYLYWPDAPDWALAELAKFVKWAHQEHGVKLASTVTWKPYPASYGTSNGARLTGPQWQDYYGWLGHQHVPENTHGDPGTLNMTRVLAYAKGTITLEEEDMNETQAKQLAELHKALVQPTIPTRVEGKTGSFTLGQHVAATNGHVYGHDGALADILARLDTLAADVAELKAGQTGGAA